MGLAHGKVSECTARLALAQGMIKVLLFAANTSTSPHLLIIFPQSLRECSMSTDEVPNRDLIKQVRNPKDVHNYFKKFVFVRDSGFFASL